MVSYYKPYVHTMGEIEICISSWQSVRSFEEKNIMLAQFVKSSRDTDVYESYEFLNIYYGNQQVKSFAKVYCKYFNKMQTCKLPK